ncbi:MAG: glycosyltransferase [Clostridia bacterium]|nr:glycosyltransferase [Clostridia bacterium]
MNNLVSFIVPVYNAEATIKYTIDSVLKQKITNWELILIDDGSVDNSFNICQSYANEDSRIILIHIENSGVSIARNTGLGLARGEWIIFVDSDDYLSENLLSVVSAYMDKYDVIGYGIQCFPENNIIALNEQKIFNSFLDTQCDFSQLYNASFYNSPCNKVYKREILKEPFDCNYSLGEDLLFNLHNLINSKQIIILDECLYYYRREGVPSLSMKVDSNSHRIQLDLRDAFINVFDGNDEVLACVNQIYVNSMIDKVWSVVYKEDFCTLQKKDVLGQWRTEGLFVSDKDVEVKGVFSKLLYCLFRHKLYGSIIILGRIKKGLSTMYHKVKK